MQALQRSGVDARRSRQRHWLAALALVACGGAAASGDEATEAEATAPDDTGEAPLAQPYPDTIAVAPAAPADPPPLAEEQRGVELEGITVTASRRVERLQQVPIAVTALNARALEQRKMRGLDEIQAAVPGFTYNQQVGSGQPTVRGVGSDIPTLAGEPGVAVYVDDVYIGRSFVTDAAFTEIDRVEVLRGPQGTLYGRNTSGGAIRFVTKRPADYFQLAGALQYGSFDQYVGRVSASGPVIDGWLNARASVFAEQRDGWLTNLATGSNLKWHRNLSLRLSADVLALDWMTISVAAHRQVQRDGEPVEQALGPVLATAGGGSLALPILAPADPYLLALEQASGQPYEDLRSAVAEQTASGRTSDNPRETYLSIDSFQRIVDRGVSVAAETDWPYATTKLILAQQSSHRIYIHDADGGEIDFLEEDPGLTSGEQRSVELQVTSQSIEPLKWVGGLFYYREGAFNQYDLTVGALPIDVPAMPLPGEPVRRTDAAANLLFNSWQNTRSAAAFAQVDWTALSWLTLSAGGRITRDEKATDILIVRPGSTQRCSVGGSWKQFTGRLGANARLGEDAMSYASFSQGFKSGGFNTDSCSDNRFEPEFVDAYEIGLKSEWFSRRLRANLATFFYEFDNIQITQIDQGLNISIVNAAAARIKGAELELSARPFEDLTIDLGAAWLDARYTRFLSDDPYTAGEGPVDVSGNRLNRSPEWTVSAGLEYAFAEFRGIAVTPRIDWAYSAEQYFSQFNRHPAARESNHLVNAFLNIDIARWQAGIQLFGKNLTDSVVVEWAAEAQPVGGTLGGYTRPRSFGVEVTFNY